MSLDQTGRVVIVAPSEYDPSIPAPPLPGQITEIAESLRAFFQPVPLIGRVTKEKLFNILRAGAVGFWFIGHGQAERGLVLSDGFVSAREIGRYLARAGVKWSYLNTCDSGALVEQLQATHPHVVYANIVSRIDDQEATQNGVLMAQGIADTGQVLMAYRWVISGGPSVLRYFPVPNGGHVSTPSIRHDDERPTAVEDRLRRLEKMIWGDEDTRYPPLVERAVEIDHRLRRLEFVLIAEAVAVVIAGILLWTRPPTVIVQMMQPTPTFYQAPDTDLYRLVTPTPTVPYFPGDVLPDGTRR